MRLDQPDPVAALEENNRLIAQRAARFNALQFKTLRYRNSIGTDFTVDLPDRHIWQGGAEPAQNGVIFTANIPTEEIYTAPDFRTANGIKYIDNKSSGILPRFNSFAICLRC